VTNNNEHPFFPETRPDFVGSENQFPASDDDQVGAIDITLHLAINLAAILTVFRL